MSEEPNDITTESILDENSNEKTETQDTERNVAEKPNKPEENDAQTEKPALKEKLIDDEKKEDTYLPEKKEAPSGK
jgi:hypothetical protein